MAEEQFPARLCVSGVPSGDHPRGWGGLPWLSPLDRWGNRGKAVEAVCPWSQREGSHPALLTRTLCCLCNVLDGTGNSETKARAH